MNEQQSPTNLSRPIDQVPQDLLTPVERRLHLPAQQICWIKTAYSADTDERYAQIKAEYQDEFTIPFHGHEAILEDSKRYAHDISSDCRAIFAFIPFLITAETSFYSEDAEEYPFESENVQSMLYPPGMDDLDRKAIGQRFVYLVDEHAVRNGEILMYYPDEFGQPLYQSRVRAENIADIVNYHSSLGFGLTGLKQTVADMHLPARPRARR